MLIQQIGLFPILKSGNIIYLASFCSKSAMVRPTQRVNSGVGLLVEGLAGFKSNRASYQQIAINQMILNLKIAKMSNSFTIYHGFSSLVGLRGWLVSFNQYPYQWFKCQTWHGNFSHFWALTIGFTRSLSILAELSFRLLPERGCWLASTIQCESLSIMNMIVFW